MDDETMERIRVLAGQYLADVERFTAAGVSQPEYRARGAKVAAYVLLAQEGLDVEGILAAWAEVVEAQ